MQTPWGVTCKQGGVKKQTAEESRGKTVENSHIQGAWLTPEAPGESVRASREEDIWQWWRRWAGRLGRRQEGQGAACHGDPGGSRGIQDSRGDLVSQQCYDHRQTVQDHQGQNHVPILL